MHKFDDTMHAASPPPHKIHTHQGQSPEEGQAELAIGAEVRLTRLLQQAELNGTVYNNMY